MDTGRLRHRVKVQSFTETKNVTGEPVQTWSLKKEVWASIKQMSGNELFEANQVRPGVTHKVRMRFLDGVTPSMRLLFGSRTLNIESVENINEQNIELVLICKEKV